MCGRDQPGHRVAWSARLRPLLDRGRDRILECVFRQVEVAELADQRRENAPAFLMKDVFDPHGRPVVRLLHRAAAADDGVSAAVRAP
jgi:hypothetical protein